MTYRIATMGFNGDYVIKGEQFENTDDALDFGSDDTAGGLDCADQNCPCHEWLRRRNEPDIECQFCDFKGTFTEGAEHRKATQHLIRTVTVGELRRNQSSGEHQPAARGGGERVIIDSDLVVQPLPNTTKFLLVVEDNDWPIAEFYRAEEAEGLAYEHNQHQVLVAERERLREALTEIAAFDDTGANEILQRTGSYSGFDEPGAVQTAREALADQKGPSE